MVLYYRFDVLFIQSVNSVRFLSSGQVLCAVDSDLILTDLKNLGGFYGKFIIKKCDKALS